MSPVEPLPLIACVLLGVVSAASAARIGRTSPLAILAPLAVAVLPALLIHPWGVLASALVTLAVFLAAYRVAPTPEQAAQSTLTAQEALVTTAALGFGLVVYAALKDGVPAPSYGVIVGMGAGLLGTAQALSPFKELERLGRNGWLGACVLLGLLSFALGATYTEWVGLLCAVAFLGTLLISLPMTRLSDFRSR